MPGLHVKMVYTRPRLSGLSDVAVTTHDFFRGDDLGDINVAGEDAIVAAFVAAWNSLASRRANNVVLSRADLYRGYNGDGSPGVRDREVVIVETPGSFTESLLPPQCAFSVTELTDRRKSWGRFYLPGLNKQQTDDEGSWLDATVDAVADAFETCYNAWQTADYGPVVWGREGAGPVPDAMTPRPVLQIRCDNLVDIIRRRRWDSPTIRTTRNVV